MNPKPQTCPELGTTHTWQRRGWTSQRGVLLFFCPTCTAWAWAAPTKPSCITPYTDPFKSRLPKDDIELTAIPRPQHGEDSPNSILIEKRGDRLPWKKGPFYTPRYVLSDAENFDMRSRRKARASRASSR